MPTQVPRKAPVIGRHADLGLGQALGSALRKVMAALPAPHRPDADLAGRRILIAPVRWRGTPGPDQPAPDLVPFQQAAPAPALPARTRQPHRHLHRTDRALSATVLDQPPSAATASS